MTDRLMFLYLHDLTDCGIPMTWNRQGEKKAEALNLSLQCGIYCNEL